MKMWPKWAQTAVRRGVSPALLALLLTAFLMADRAKAVQIRLASAGDNCLALVTGTAPPGVDQGRLRFRLVTSDGRAVTLEPVRSGDIDSVELTAGDFRVPFEKAEFSDTIALQNAPIWRAMAAGVPFHVTARLKTGGFRSSIFNGFVPGDVLDRLASTCGLIVNDADAQAQEDGLSRSQRLFAKALLRRIAEEPDLAPTESDTLVGSDRSRLETVLRDNGRRPSRTFDTQAMADLMAITGLVTPAEFTALTPVAGNLAGFRKGRRWGLMTTKGDILITPRFSDALPPQKDLWPVRTRRGWTVIDPDGQPQVDWVAESLGPCAAGWCTIAEGGKKGFVNLATGRRIRPRYDEVSTFGEGFAAVRQGDDWQIISELGKPVRRFRGVTGIFTPRASVARYQLPNSRIGFVAIKGDNPYATTFEDARDFHGGLAAVKLDGKWGYVSRLNGSMVIAPQFDGAGDFSRGLAPASADGNRWGLIDKSGGWALPPQMAGIRSAKGGFVVLTNARGQQALRSIGRDQSQSIWFDALSDVTNGHATYRLGKSVGLISTAALRRN